MSSPSAGYGQRFTELSVQVSELQRRLSEGREARLEHLQREVGELAARLVAAKRCFQAELSPLKEVVDSLRKKVQEAREGDDSRFQAQQQQLSNLDERLKQAFQDAQRGSAETEARLLEAFGKRSQLLRDAVEREGGLRQSAEELLHGFLEREVPELRKRLTKASEERTALQQRALERVRRQVLLSLFVI
ncbi:hypothetical protein AK812_SmicGene6333 [Symbiodinium microadriaticum]|uniref:Uncharacterized protein n=1 Tax=Symbiodinium microadriaticum TaxID=2951 RepID=A0A1Q9ERK1_SYMMI|nr:hypothetical protein AK812_SmicGene6333 [Symbiodinium microadriaticum]